MIRGQLDGTIAAREKDKSAFVDASDIWLPDLGEIADLKGGYHWQNPDAEGGKITTDRRSESVLSFFVLFIFIQSAGGGMGDDYLRKDSMSLRKSFLAQTTGTG